MIIKFMCSMFIDYSIVYTDAKVPVRMHTLISAAFKVC